jgi:membrane-associated phospholipid phosphatase
MFTKLLISLLFFFSIQSAIIAQDVKKDTIPETKGEKKQESKHYNVTQFAHETFMFFKQPVRWQGNDWLKIGIVTAATLSAMTLDKTAVNATQGHQKYYYSVPVVAGRVYGEWYSIGAVAAVFGCYGILNNDSSAKKITIELVQAGIYSEIVTEMFKVVIGRARPVSGESSTTYHPFSTVYNYNSIPSGHSTAAMALSTVMSRHANSTALKILAYLPAALTMFSRIYQNQHWISDVVPGAAIGYFAGNWVVDLHEGKRHRIKLTSVYPPSVSINLDPKSTHK